MSKFRISFVVDMPNNTSSSALKGAIYGSGSSIADAITLWDQIQFYILPNRSTEWVQNIRVTKIRG